MDTSLCSQKQPSYGSCVFQSSTDDLGWVDDAALDHINVGASGSVEAVVDITVAFDFVNDQRTF